MSFIDDVPIISDRPKRSPLNQYAGIGISVVALMVSLLSLWLSFRNSALQNEMARPVFEVVSARFNSPYDPKSPINRPGDAVLNTVLEIKNVGHLTAHILGVNSDSDLLEPKGSKLDECNEQFRNVKSGGYTDEVNIEPGITVRLNQTFALPSVCRGFSIKRASLFVTLLYGDSTSHGRYKQYLRSTEDVVTGQ